jgi:hypothetical protein
MGVMQQEGPQVSDFPALRATRNKIYLFINTEAQAFCYSCIEGLKATVNKKEARVIL